MLQAVRNLLRENLGIKPNDLYILPAPLGLQNLWQLYTSVERYDLKFPLYSPFVPKVFQTLGVSNDIFETIRDREYYDRSAIWIF
jgi:polyphosphate kinase